MADIDCLVVGAGVVGDVPHAGDRVLQGRALVVVQALQHGDAEVVLVVEVGVERTPGEPGGLADLLDRSPQDALLGEYVDGGVDESLPSGGTACGDVRHGSL